MTDNTIFLVAIRLRVNMFSMVVNEDKATPIFSLSVVTRIAMAYPPVSNASLSTKVELHNNISCKTLLKADIRSKSDPLTALYTSDNAGEWFEVRSS